MLDFLKICKFCGSNEDVVLYNVFESEVEEMNNFNVTLPFRIQQSLQIDVVHEDVICQGCLFRVNYFYFFKEASRDFYKRIHKSLDELYPSPVTQKTTNDVSCEDVEILEEKLVEHPVVPQPPDKRATTVVSAVATTSTSTSTSETEAEVIDICDVPSSSGISSTNGCDPEDLVKRRGSKRPFPSVIGDGLNGHLEQFATAASLEELRNSLIESTTNTPRTKCSVCSLTLPSPSALKRHLALHTNESPFECQICTKTFKDQSYLLKHERMHRKQQEEVPKFMCQYCDLPFTQKKDLQNHVKDTHFLDTLSDSEVEITMPDDAPSRASPSPERHVVCRLCLKTFKDADELNEHKMVHEKKRKKQPQPVVVEEERKKKEVFHRCPQCQETFHEKANLEKHKKLAHSVCEHCDKLKLYDCSCSMTKRKLRTMIVTLE